MLQICCLLSCKITVQSSLNPFHLCHDCKTLALSFFFFTDLDRNTLLSFDIKFFADWFNPFGELTRELASCWAVHMRLTYGACCMTTQRSCASAAVKGTLIPLQPPFPNQMVLQHLWASYFKMCNFRSAKQVMIELPFFLFSSQGCTWRCEWWRGSSRRTCYHVGGKKTVSLFAWVFIVRCIIWHEGTSVRRLLIKGSAFLACCSRDNVALQILAEAMLFPAVKYHLQQCKWLLPPTVWN